MNFKMPSTKEFNKMLDELPEAEREKIFLEYLKDSKKEDKSTGKASQEK